MIVRFLDAPERRRDAIHLSIDPQGECWLCDELAPQHKEAQTGHHPYSN
jgi:hypothetical protein